jgi:predicted nucleic acid-binding protein
LIAVDTSSLIAFLTGETGRDVEAVEIALRARQAALPPAAVSEALSDPKLARPAAKAILAIPTLEIRDGYWERVGALRARILSRGLRARLADALIAQSCIDHEVPLVSRDRDFRHYARWGGLRLV